jgi:hypothetical protein
MRGIMVFISAAMIFTFPSCGKQTLGPEAYLKWVSDPANGMVKEKELDPFRLELRYMPTGLRTLREQRDGIESTEEMDDLLEFQLQLGSMNGTEFLRTGISDMQEYHARIEYYLSHVQGDLRLVIANDTLDCVLHHFERTYGVAPYNTLMVAFEGQEPTASDMEFIYDDRVLGIGRTKFTIASRDIAHIPNLRP